ncbi:beta/gamma crystallin family protein [Massilia sp. PAMC28688]|uniref:beta/gamma crystallin-related protein n=1 Tax=Massilia sp. PAMC28688 TaxID=2861283 RepID=UPI001C62C44B|nr:beta/gamma crystallin-related protein [Massilia sp. PAMC28688]QYF94086.1 beta/gamma crystallin family protein [Massilia sp. PAMC28688]
MKSLLNMAAVAFTASLAQAAGAGEVILFSAGDFDGREVRLRGDTPDLNRYGFNDRSASMVVQSGIWELCFHARYQGECRIYEPGQYRSLGRFTGNLSSLREIERGDSRDERGEWRDARRRARQPELVLFEGTNLGGRALPIRGGNDNLARAGFNDRAQSMLIERGRWEVCQHRDFGGMCRVYGPGEYRVLDRSLRRAISSVRLVSSGRSRGYGPDTGYGRALPDHERGDFDRRDGYQPHHEPRYELRDDPRNDSRNDPRDDSRDDPRYEPRDDR